MHRFQVTIGRTRAGSVELVFSDLSGSAFGRDRTRRELSAQIYILAAELERRAAELRALWCVSPTTFNGKLVVELTGEDRADEVEQLVRRAIVDWTSVEIVA